MPSVSKKQHNLMEAVAHNPAFAKKVGIKQSVGKEFASADKGKKFREGGMAESKKMVGKEVSFMKKKGAPKSMIKHEEAEMAGMKKGGMAKKADLRGRALKKTSADAVGRAMKLKKGGKVSSASKRADGIAQRGKTKGRMV